MTQEQFITELATANQAAADIQAEKKACLRLCTLNTMTK